MKTGLFKDILKTKTEKDSKYSQGRVYLFVFVVAYLACLIYYMFSPTDTMQTIIDAIQWAVAVFATYVFGGKGVEAARDVLNKRKTKDDTDKTSYDLHNQPSAVDTTTKAIKSGEVKEEDLST